VLTPLTSLILTTAGNNHMSIYVVCHSDWLKYKLTQHTATDTDISSFTSCSVEIGSSGIRDGMERQDVRNIELLRVVIRVESLTLHLTNH